MKEEVAIVSFSYFLKPKEEIMSDREILYTVVKSALDKVGLTRDDIQSIITTDEDFTVGRAIADEFTVDYCGGKLKPNARMCAESMLGLITGFMHIKTGMFDLVLVGCYDKYSHIEHPYYLTSLALDPVFEHPLLANPLYIAACEMRSYSHKYKVKKEDIAEVVVKARKNALKNKDAAYGNTLKTKDVLKSKVIVEPIREMDIAPEADGAVCFILASPSRSKKLTKKPVWITGVGYSSDSASSSWHNTDLADAGYIKQASQKAYKMAKIKNVLKEISFAEIDDKFSYKLLQHIEGLGICKEGEGAKFIKSKISDTNGSFPINPSGGSLGNGTTLSTAGGMRVAEACKQLLKQADGYQIKNANRAVCASWAGIPTRSGGVVVLEGGGK